MARRRISRRATSHIGMTGARPSESTWAFHGGRCAATAGGMAADASGPHGRGQTAGAGLSQLAINRSKVVASRSIVPLLSDSGEIPVCKLLSPGGAFHHPPGQLRPLCRKIPGKRRNTRRTCRPEHGATPNTEIVWRPLFGPGRGLTAPPSCRAVGLAQYFRPAHG